MPSHLDDIEFRQFGPRPDPSQVFYASTLRNGEVFCINRPDVLDYYNSDGRIIVFEGKRISPDGSSHELVFTFRFDDLGRIVDKEAAAPGQFMCPDELMSSLSVEARRYGQLFAERLAKRKHFQSVLTRVAFGFSQTA
jgi:hypothetical protein